MPTSPTLPRELLAILHHVQLHKDGWWSDAVDRTILAVLTTTGQPATAADITRDVARHAGFQVERSVLEERLDALSEAGNVLAINGKFSISEALRAQIGEDRERLEVLEARSRERFQQLLSRYGVAMAADIAWQRFLTGLLQPLVYELGALTWKLVHAEQQILGQSETLSRYLSQFAESERVLIRRAVVDFFDPEDQHVRPFVLSHLNAYFLLSAGHLDRETLDALERTNRTKPEFIVILDTNVVFSLLGLHLNPSNEATRALMDLVSGIGDRASVEFAVLATTVDEARRTLNGAVRRTPDASRVRAVAEAGFEREEVYGITARYFQVVAEAPEPVSPQAYFQPYIDGLQHVLDDRKIRIIDDEVLRSVFESGGLRQDARHAETAHSMGQKAYPQIHHDLVLLEYVRRLRPSEAAKFFEVRYWGLTADHGLVEYASRRHKALSLPLVVRPAQLIQMFRFWVPRTPEMERALLGSIRMPLLMSAFDQKSEQTTKVILEQVSRYAGSKDLTKEIVLETLRDNALRQRIEDGPACGEDPEEHQRKAVESSLVDRAVEREHEVEVLKESQAELIRRADEMDRRFKDARRNAEGGALVKRDLKEKNDKLLETLNKERERGARTARDAAATRQELAKVSEEVEQLKAQQAATERRSVATRTRWRWAGSSAALLLAVGLYGGLGFVWARHWLAAQSWHPYLYALSCVLLWAAACGWIVRFFQPRDPDWWLFKAAVKAPGWIVLTGVASLIGTIIQFALAKTAA
jgi:hypothetical protein